ncbi:MAG: response regulator, partial [Azoarcus sp.]|nr:response regulator [Azoarcus sp.]
AAGRASPDGEFAIDDENERVMRAEPPSVEVARAQGRLILVAEDNEINQKVILHQLALLGFAAEVADDGHEALQRWRTGHHALVLTDLHMPIMDGYALARAIREADGPGCHTPVLALTANALRGEERRALDAGMDAYLTKPVQLEHLRATLQAHLPSAAENEAPVLPQRDAGTAMAVDTRATDTVFDVSVLEELVGDDAQIVREFLDEFRRSAADLGRELAEAHARGAIDETGNAAHKLKSAARSVGALTLGELAAAIERAVRSDDIASLSARVETLHTLLAETDEHIETWLGSR